MARIVVELILAFLIGIMPFGGAKNTVEPVAVSETPAAKTAEVTSQQEDGVKCARFENMLEHNFAFGECLSETDLITASTLSLSNLITDGSIQKSAVDNFIFNMYGVDSTAYPEGAIVGTYDVVPLGYDRYDHVVKSFTYNGDGTITVLSEMTVNGEEKFLCESLFLANGESIFGYNLLSCIVEW